VCAWVAANTLELHKCVSVCMGDSKYVGPAQVCVCVSVSACMCDSYYPEGNEHIVCEGLTKFILIPLTV